MGNIAQAGNMEGTSLQMVGDAWEVGRMASKSANASGNCSRRGNHELLLIVESGMLAMFATAYGRRAKVQQGVCRYTFFNREVYARTVGERRVWGV